MTPRSTEILVAVECLKAGQKACTADSNGNIGSDNKGRNNFCTKNIADDNIGHMQLNFRLASQCNVSLGLCSLGEEESGVSRHKGFSKSGSIRTSTLHTMGLSMSAIRVSTLEIMTPRSTEILVAVECLKAGQKACTADSNGNIGSDNKGRNNFCTKNIADDNIEVTTANCQEVSIPTR
ncbi:hypothetical protein F751_5735 [Auxenochlorella protothecoides]|uniref:Uncharacterized protein n=1 Tax=Auxenochlorella protothecoides TaxID=3075 RepID=A0A087SU93_AUXPR|nr:hypothetical protein F751_5735 [Auxenochlorella protothecoides]KFM29297.1 hypothetical protein F751_5735 [Auxenochlorella protothecoides]